MTRSRLSGAALIGVLAVTGCGLAPPALPPARDAAPSSSALSSAQPGSTLAGFSDAERAALRIRNIGCGGVATGSGFALDEHILVTNRHVVGGATTLQVSTFDGRDINVTASSAAGIADLAIVRTTESLPGRIPLAESDPEVGEPVTAVGYPLGGPLTTTQGHVLGFEKDPIGWSQLPMLVNDAPIEHGSSGSPLLDSRGKLVGIVYATSGQDPQFAVPVEVLAKLLASPEQFNAASNCDGVLRDPGSSPTASGSSSPGELTPPKKRPTPTPSTSPKASPTPTP